MKNLEKIIREHKNEFDENEPQEAHFKNFLEKLNTPKKRNLFESIPNFLKVAVIITFVIFSGFIGYQIRNMQENTYGLGTISPEYREVEAFYTANINSQLGMLKQLGSFDKEQHQSILSEELKDMDERYSQLKKELKLHPDDDRIIQAMIEYYQVKTNVLNRIIEQLYQIKKQNRNKLNTAV
ncbi:hypothetical protein BZG02_13990 [Labilibaculum filiforme]|uniref:Anti-sigma factor n=1 Tax=Labilibaculum filiforme TaxID=1940526 RepID=A0A2N3HVE4_9BACT|nr:hypothetical protein [Labilibaculum filiforme]PKQ62045.1 hypothetical protein BZG02_13990 [Labilibaculum filiforme]